MAADTMTRLLTRTEAAAHLAISVQRLDALRAAGGGPEWGQWHGTIRYSVDELDAWLMPTRPGTGEQPRPPADLRT